jgi:ribokinase
MTRVVVCGSVNQDTSVRIGRVPVAGDTVLVDSGQTSLGGKGANQAVACAALGLPTSLLGAVGTDPAASRVIDALGGHGVDLGLLQCFQESPTGQAWVMVTPEGDNAIVVQAGANRLLTVSPEAESAMRRAAAVVCQLEVPLPTVAAALAAARGGSALSVLNAAPALAGARALLPGVDLLVVNESEARELTGTDDPVEAATSLRGEGAATVAVTLGRRGALLLTAGELVEHPAYEVETVDTTGAGDCFVAALVYAYLGGHATADALRFACAAGALATTVAGAAARPSRDDIAVLIAKEKK